ncbi:TolC family outer membrane protein [Falsihalocynthiibacter sp. S25ZX9]|uniref:TolC family outer membrane protein n=1 Tax=Falsihalocynthiibacter sp. S25ZX9 TaxID=3240870 RepID=UPI00351057B8
MSGQKMKKVIGFTVAMLMSSTIASRAETLADALVSAYNNSGLLEQNRALLRAADEDVAQSVAALRPTLSYIASLDYSYSDLERPNLGGYSDGLGTGLNLVAEMTLYDFGRNQLAVKASKESVLAARENLIGIEQQVLFNAINAFLSLSEDLEFVDLRQNNLRVIGQELKAAQDRFEVGEVTRTDVSNAEARLAAAQAGLAEAKGEVAVSREVYNSAIGHYPTTLASPPRAPKVATSLDAARDVALRNHPDLKAVQRTIKVAELNEERAERLKYPTLNGAARAGLNGVWNEYDSSSAVVSLELSGPIYQGGRLPSLARQALAAVQAERAQLHLVSLAVQQNVGTAWARLLVSEASLSSRQAQVVAAQSAFDGTREEAALGARTTLDVLNAEQEVLDAKADVIVANTIRYLADYALLAQMGLLTAEHLKLKVQIYDPSVYYNAVENAPSGYSKQGKALDRVLKGLGKE